MIRSHILVCGGTGCVASGCKAVYDAMEESVKKHGLDKEMQLVLSGCHGLCALGPMIVVYPDTIFYAHVKP
jgi:NADP-reducing hydrogenase subunit HndC